MKIRSLHFVIGLDAGVQPENENVSGPIECRERLVGLLRFMSQAGCMITVIVIPDTTRSRSCVTRA